jgi:type IV secretion system pilin
MISILKRWIGVGAGLFGAAAASIVLADTGPVVLQNPLNTTDATVVLGYINTFLLAIAAPICGIMVVWGGFQMITSMGDPEKFSTGKKTLLYAAIGFVVVILASSVVPLMKSIFNGS